MFSMAAHSNGTPSLAPEEETMVVSLDTNGLTKVLGLFLVLKINLKDIRVGFSNYRL